MSVINYTNLPRQTSYSIQIREQLCRAAPGPYTTETEPHFQNLGAVEKIDVLAAEGTPGTDGLVAKLNDTNSDGYADAFFLGRKLDTTGSRILWNNQEYPMYTPEELDHSANMPGLPLVLSSDTGCK